MMRAEALVFIRKQQLEELRVDVGDVSRKPPAAFARRISAQQPSVSIKHAGRKHEVIAKRRRTERNDPIRRDGECQHAHKRSDGERKPHSRTRHCDPTNPREVARARGLLTVRQCRHLPATTSTLALPLRPNRSGRYISSTLACGRTYLPTETARTT